jgi:pimeloyl-ACP methyl ester carboxylesterase
VIWAEDDIALPSSLLDGLENFVPQMRLVRLPGATHWVIHERPATVAGEIERELSSS